MDEAERLLKEFEEEIKYRNRFIIKHEAIDFFNEIIKDFTEVIQKGKILYRGRVNQWMDKQPYSDEDLGMPDPGKKLTLGRSNPYGINYMYLAEDIDTVVAELRPNRDSLITIGEYELLKDITLVELSDLIVHSDKNVCDLALMLGRKFSLPIDKNKEAIDYLPTQYFSELCKNSTDKKIDGIKFLSSVMNNATEHHYNITLFDDNNTVCRKKFVHRVCKIEYQHEILDTE